MSRLRDVELELAQLLEAAGLGVLSGPTLNLFPGPYPPNAPDAFLACRLSGGEDPERYLSTGVQDHHVTVTVLVRGERGPDAYNASRVRAAAAWEALNDARPPSYQWVRAEGGGPLYQGEDDDGRPRWSFSVEAFYSSTP